VKRRNLALYLIPLTVLAPTLARSAALQRELTSALLVRASALTIPNHLAPNDCVTILCAENPVVPVVSTVKSCVETATLDTQTDFPMLTPSPSRAIYHGLVARVAEPLPDCRLFSAPDRAPPSRLA
jgi:hypothetical protein